MIHRLLGKVIVAGGLALSISAVARAQAPGPTSAVAAVGPLIGDTVTFSWTRVAASTYYELWVNDDRGAQLDQWFTAAQAGCDGGQPLCRVTVTRSLAPGTVRWWVRTWSPSGYGPWSAEHAVAAAGDVLHTRSETSSLSFGFGAGNPAASSGLFNTAAGTFALAANLTGERNTASGFQALYRNVDGSDNTAFGAYALHENVTGLANTAVGYSALYNSVGVSNTAVGANALFQTTTGGGNTAIGAYSLFSNVTGNSNVAVGSYSGVHATGSNNIYLKNDGIAGESNTIRIGTIGSSAYSVAHTRAFIGGIYGVTSSGGSAVFVNSSGQLGTITSSRRFKTDIHDIGRQSEAIMRLRPVSFKYVPSIDPDGLKQFGLLAEEVADIMPELVIRGDDGQPLTVRYHLLTPLLLNEMQRVRRDLARQNEELARLAEELRGLLARDVGIDR